MGSWPPPLPAEPLPSPGHRLSKVPPWGWAMVVGVPSIVIGALLVPMGDTDSSTIEIGEEPAPRAVAVESSAVSTDPPVSSIADTTTTSSTMAPAATASTVPAPVTTPPTTEATVTPAGDPSVLLGLLDGLTVADPDPARPAYERDSYDRNGWADPDGDCVTVRHDLLRAFSLEPVLMDSTGCRVEAGLWSDPYTGSALSTADEATIDHVVPLAEAHRSGAWRWDDDTRFRFSNDIFPGHLVVVGYDVNQSKADKRPDEWLPPDPAGHCQYAANWVTTKDRYSLTVTAAEAQALRSALATCVATGGPDSLTDIAAPLVVVTVPTTTTTTTIAPTAGPGHVALLSCHRRDEVVVIGNAGGSPVSLSGYTLHDIDNNHSVELGQFGGLDPGQQLRILSGEDAAPSQGAVVWKRQHVWNNDGDTAHLIAPDGTSQTSRC